MELLKNFRSVFWNCLFSYEFLLEFKSSLFFFELFDKNSILFYFILDAILVMLSSADLQEILSSSEFVSNLLDTCA